MPNAAHDPDPEQASDAAAGQPRWLDAREVEAWLATVSTMTLSHLPRVVSRLEKAGWARRIPDPDDGRYTRAVLTDSGWAKVRQSAPGHVEAVRRYVFDALTADQATALGGAAAAVVAAVNPPGIARA